MINCDEFHKFMDDYVYDDVSFFVKAQMDEHIASCPKCRDEIKFLQEIKSTLYTMPKLEVDDSFRAALNQRLDEIRPVVKNKKKRRFYRDWRTYSALAACLVLAFVVQSKVGEFYHQGLTDPAPQEVTKTIDPEGSQLANAAMTAEDDAASATPAADTGVTGIRSTEKPAATPERQTAAPATQKPGNEDKATATPKPTTVPATTKPAASPENQKQQNLQQDTAVPMMDAAQAPAGSDNTVLKASSAGPVAPANEQERVQEDRTESAPREAGGSGGAAGGGSVNTKQVSAAGKVSVEADNVSKAKEIADKYGTVNGDSVEMTKKEFQNYLNTLQKNDIKYSHNVPDGDVVEVEIVAE